MDDIWHSWFNSAEIFPSYWSVLVAHDAMHHSLAPLNEKLNNNLGRLCLFLYAGLSYKSCSKKHGLHHRYPESEADPDFHSPQNSKPIIWYFRFLSNYLNCRQFCTLTLVWLLMLQITTLVNPNAVSYTHLTLPTSVTV